MALGWRGATGGERVVAAGEIERAGGAALVLRDGVELPLHRVRAVRAGGLVLWERRPPGRGSPG